MSKLEDHRCIECDNPVRIPMTLPYEGKEEPTAMTIHYMDENQNSHLIGVLCLDCAFGLCNKGIVGIGYAGFPHSWDAWVSEPHKFPFEKKNEIKCRCSICTQEEYDQDWPW